MMPYYLMLKRDLKLPIKEIILLEKTILGRVIELIYKMLIFRKSVKVTINRAQQRMKANYQIK